MPTAAPAPPLPVHGRLLQPSRGSRVSARPSVRKRFGVPDRTPVGTSLAPRALVPKKHSRPAHAVTPSWRTTALPHSPPPRREDPRPTLAHSARPARKRRASTAHHVTERVSRRRPLGAHRSGGPRANFPWSLHLHTECKKVMETI